MPRPSFASARSRQRRVSAAARPESGASARQTTMLTLLAALLLSGLLLLLPAALGAQIATGLTAPAPRPTPGQVAAADSAAGTARDSAVIAERMDMRAWVDSAATALERGGAAVTPMPDVPGDSTVPDTTPATGTPRAGIPVNRPAAQAAAPGATTRFREGAPAPDTATPLPLLLALGFSLATAGAGLLRRR